YEMRAAGGAEDGAGSAHVPDCVMDVTTVLATPPLFPSKGHARTGDPRHQRLLLVVYSAVDEAHRAAALYELVGGRDLTRPQHLRHPRTSYRHAPALTAAAMVSPNTTGAAARAAKRPHSPQPSQ